MVTEPVYPEVASDGSLVVFVRPPETREAVAVADYTGPVCGERVVVLQTTEWLFYMRATTPTETTPVASSSTSSTRTPGRRGRGPSPSLSTPGSSLSSDQGQTTTPRVDARSP